MSNSENVPLRGFKIWNPRISFVSTRRSEEDSDENEEIRRERRKAKKGIILWREKSKAKQREEAKQKISGSEFFFPFSGRESNHEALKKNIFFF